MVGFRAETALRTPFSMFHSSANSWIVLHHSPYFQYTTPSLRITTPFVYHQFYNKSNSLFVCFFVFSISSFLIRNRNYDYVLADSTLMQIRNTSTNSIITMMDIISIIISRSFTLLHSNNISIKLMHRMIDKVSVVVAASALLFNDFRRHFQCTAHCPCFTVS